MSSSAANKDVSKLTLAAEELIKAASAHVETTSIALSQETVQELKKISQASSSLGSKLDALNQKLSLLEKSTDVKFSEICAQTILHLDMMSKSVALLMKHQRIDWAIANASIGTFNCLDRSDGYQRQSSSTEIIKMILSTFRMNCGHVITKYETNDGGYSIKDGKAEFRAAIVKQLYNLLGTQPRLVSNDEQCVIYYG